jgi:hypothetical protein
MHIPAELLSALKLPFLVSPRWCIRAELLSAVSFACAVPFDPVVCVCVCTKAELLSAVMCVCVKAELLSAVCVCTKAELLSAVMCGVFAIRHDMFYELP